MIEFVRNVLAGGLLTWLGLFALLLTFRGFQSGQIMSSGVLQGRDADRNVEPNIAVERVVQASLFPAFLIYYAFNALNVDVGTDPKLPDIPPEFLALLTGSSSLYMAGAIARTRSSNPEGDAK